MLPGYYPTVMREPNDDEYYVMKAYERHTSRCPHCVRPLRIRGEGKALCDRGFKYARDVANYIFTQNGKFFSVVASERGRRVQVKMPRESLGVRSLLAAIEDGLILYSQPSITGIPCHNIRQWQTTASYKQSRHQSPKLKTYKIIERKPQQVEPEAFPRRIVHRHTGHPPLYNAGCVGQPQSQHEPLHRYWIIERYPRARAPGTLA